MLFSEGDYFNVTKIKKSIDNIKSKQLFSKIDYKVSDSEKKDFKNISVSLCIKIADNKR